MRFRVMVLAALLVAVSFGPAFAKQTTPELWFSHRCANAPTSAVLACVHRASIRYGQSYREARAIAFRESRFDPGVCNFQGSGACGLYQFMPGTWAFTPQSRYGSRFSAKWAALGAMWMWAHGYKSHWGL